MPLTSATRLFRLCVDVSRNARLVLLCVGSVATAQTQPALSAPQCQVNQIAQWNFVSNKMRGGIAADVSGATIGTYPTNRFGLWANWYPLLPQKVAVCGNLRYFKIYDFGADEHDWNLFLTLTDEFAAFFSSAADMAEDPSDVWSCSFDSPGNSDRTHPADCFEAEVTPQANFLAQNPWFTRSNQGRRAQQVCAYGPFVAEHVHGARPEVHPIEALWYGASDHVTFIEVQDASNRFNQRGLFDGAPAEFEAWAATPRRHQLKVPVSIPVGAESHLVVEHVRGCTAHNGAYAGEPTSGDVVFSVEGGATLRATLQLETPTARISAGDFCTNGTSVIGYLNLDTTIGDGTANGYQVLSIRRSDVPASADSCSSTAPITLNPLTNSIRAAKGQLLLDAQVEGVRPVQPATATGHKLKVRASDAQSGTITGIPVGGSQTVSIAPGHAVQVGTTIHPRIDALDRVTKETATNAQATSPLAIAAGGKPTNVQGIRAVTLDSTRVSVSSIFVPIRDGRPVPEDTTDTAEALNAQLKAKSTLFSARNPSLTWSYQGLNCGSGSNIKCTTGKRTTISEVRPSETNSRMDIIYVVRQGDNLTIFWPFDADTLYQLTVTVKATDPVTHTSDSITQQYWNRELSLPADRTEAIQAAMLFAARASDATNPETLVQPPPELGTRDNLRVVNDSWYREFELFRNFAAAAADDGYIDVSELERLIRAADRVSHLVPLH